MSFYPANKMSNFLGIEIGGTKLQLLLADERLSPIKTFQFKVDQKAGGAGIRSTIEKVLDNTRSFNLKAIGVGFGGPINKSTGKIFTSYHINGWSDFPIRKWLEGKSNCEVFVDNDANVAALGEALYGAGKSHRVCFYVTLGSGVGAGLTIEKKIYHGAEPAEAEFGHIRLNKQGLTLQDSCSGWAVNEKIRSAKLNDPETLLHGLTTTLEGNEAAALSNAVKAGDKTAITIFEDTLDDLSFGLSHAVHLYNPDIVILGGGLSLIGEMLRERVESGVKKYIMDALPCPLIQLSELKENAVPVGAVALAINVDKIYERVHH